MKSLEAMAQSAMNKAMDIHPLVAFAGSNPSGSIKVWIVAGHAGDYAVYEECGVMHCTCEAAQRGIICYHRAAVKLAAIEADASKAFRKALDASIAEREAEDNRLAIAVGAWHLKYKAPKADKATAPIESGFDLRNVLSFQQEVA